MGLKRKRFRCGWRTLWVLAVCMVEIGHVRVKAGNAPIEQKISAYPPQADICAFVSTSLETKKAARRPSQGSGRPKCKREWRAEDHTGGSNGEILKRSIVLPGSPRQRTFARFLGWFGARLSGQPWHQKTGRRGRRAQSQSAARLRG